MKFTRNGKILIENNFCPVVSKDMNMPFISFRKSCPNYGQFLYLVYSKDTGFEFIGRFAKDLNVFGPVKVYKEWQNRELGFDLNKFFRDLGSDYSF
ncbi:hypothetical protein [Ekhidna sp.]|uniref:hypothetical protein n=1 Tax=Ekhidna sp. TaxID=2608089 RepID=UPI003C7974B7